MIAGSSCLDGQRPGSALADGLLAAVLRCGQSYPRVSFAVPISALSQQMETDPARLFFYLGR